MAWPTAQPTYASDPFAAYPFGAPVTVSTETPLLPLTALGHKFGQIMITLRNHDLTNRAAVYVDQSESGIAPDEGREVEYIGPGKERRIVFDDVTALYWGISASGDPDAAFPSVNVSWQLVGRAR